MDGVAVKPLTVGFHETQFLPKLNQENRLGFWFQLSDKQRQQTGSPWGPSNPQALNRYSYVLNNPLKYTDPSGHAGITYHGYYDDNGAFHWNGHVTLHLSHSDLEVMKDWTQAEWTWWIEATLVLLGIARPDAAAAAGLIAATMLGTQGGVMSLYLLSLLTGSNGIDITFNAFSPYTTMTGSVGTVNRQQGVFFGNKKVIKSCSGSMNPPTLSCRIPTDENGDGKEDL
jgi:hypothetical protein